MATRFSTAFLAVFAIGSGVGASDGANVRSAGGDQPATSDHLVDQIGALEERSYAAWKSRDAKFWTAFLSEKFVGWGPAGRVDKRTALPVLNGTSCKIASYRLSDKQVTRLTPGAAVLTHRTEVDGTCSGKPVVPASYTVTAYVREAGQWKAAFRAQAAVVDPMKATRPAASDLWTGGPTSTDAATQTLQAREQAVVNAWKDHDTGRMAELFGPSVQFVDIYGDHIGTRAAALKAWSGEGCNVKSFDISGAKATLFAPDFGVLTYRSTWDGKCFGQDLWPIWSSAFYVRHGDTWLWSSGINVLAGAGAD